MILADPGMLDKVEGLDELPVMDAPLEQQQVRTVAEYTPSYQLLGSQRTCPRNTITLMLLLARHVPV